MDVVQVQEAEAPHGGGGDEPGEGPGGGGASGGGEDSDSGDDPGDGPGGGRDAVVRSWRRDDDEVKLMRGWLAQTLNVNEHYSVQLPPSADPYKKVLVFQVLTLEHNPSLVATFATDTESKALYNIHVQMLEVWSMQPVDSPTLIETFCLEDPVVLDPLCLLGDNMMDRTMWRTWKATTSDVDGCLSLVEPAECLPTGKLCDAQMPVLCLLDSLVAEGFVGHRGKLTHKEAAPKQYDSRKLSARRRYLQCVLCIQDLTTAGVEAWPSDQPAKYYELLLRTKQPVLPNLGDKEYARQLALLDGDRILVAALDKEPESKKARIEDRPAIADFDSYVAGDDCPPLCDKPAETRSTSSSSKSSSSSTSSSSTSSSSSQSASIAGDADASDDGYPHNFDGVPLQRMR